MADDSTFGGGLALSTGGGQGDASADAPPLPASAPAAGPAPAQGGGFGSGIAKMLPGPNYTPPDPNASPLDQTADTLQQRIKRANSIASNPMLQFLNPEDTAKARDFVPQATEALEKIRQQQAGIQAGRQQAATLGLAPGEVRDEATQADRVEAAKAKALAGDLKAFQGLSSVVPETAAAIEDRVHEVVAGHLDKADYAFNKLSGMHNEGQYAAAVQAMRKDGTLTDLEALGLKVPPSFEAFNSSKADEGRALREARIASENLKAKIAERGNGTPMAESEQKTYKGTLTTAYNDEINGGNWQRIKGKRVYVVNGMGDINDLQKKYALASPEQRAALHADTKAAVEDKEIEKFRNFNRTRDLAIKDDKGNVIPSEGVTDPKTGRKRYINDNPNVQQGIAEGLASMLRGGTGGATSGLLNIETSKRGYVQAAIDKILTNYGGAVNALTGEQVRPYLTELTQEQQRAVLDGLASYSGKSIAERVQPIAERAGALGLDASALGLGKGEIQGVEDALKSGRDSTIARFKERARSTNGGDGGIYLDDPPSVLASKPLLPGATQPGPVPAPVQPVPPQPGAPAGGPAGPQLPAPGGPQPQGPGPAGGPPAASAQPPGTATPAPAGPQPAGGPTAPVAPPVGGPTPGRFGLPPNMPLNSPQALDAAANRTMQIESGFKPGQTTGSYKGLSQWSDAELKRHGITNPDDVGQNRKALVEDIQARAAKLQKDGLPVTASNVYLMHQQGEAGLEAHLRNPDGAAWENVRQFYKSDAVAKAAVWGNMTPEMRKQFPDGVNSVKSGDFTKLWAARYDGTDNNGKANIENAAGRRSGLSASGRTAPRATEEPANLPDTGMPPTGIEGMSREDIQRANDNTVQHAPAVASIAGAIAGSAAGPLGTVAGGAAGGGAGQAFKDYMQGRPFNATQTAKETLLGGVLGIAPEGRPVVGALTRAIGAGSVEAGATAAEGGNAADISDAALTGGAYALGGEALARFISAAGPVAHKVLSNYLPTMQKEISAQAGKLAEARKTLETEQPKLAGEGAGPNPKYEAAKKTEEDATQFIKDHNQNPDDMVYAYEQVKAGTSAGEAAVLRGANKEKAATSAGYNDLRQQVNEAGVGAPKPNQQVPDGPVSTIRTAENPTGKVEEKFRPDAEHAEMLIKAPAKSWGEKWQQLQNAGTELINKRIAFLKDGDKPSATAMDSIFQGVRNQQKAAAEYVFGKERGAEVIKNLEGLDKSYAKVMNATAGMDYGKMKGILQGGNTPEARELEKNFREFSKGDPSAMRAFNAMKAGAKGRMGEEAKLMAPVIAGEFATHMAGIPTMGTISALVGGHRLYKLMEQHMNARLLGKAVTFKDFLASQIKNSGAHMLPAISVGQRGAVMQ